MTTRKAIDAGNREKRRADLDDVEGVGQVDRTGVGSKGVEQRILDDDSKPERHQQDVAIISACGGTDDQPLQAISEQVEQWCQDQRSDVGIETQRSVREERREQRGSEQRAMREIDDVQDAVYQGQAERDERIDGAGHQSVEHRREQDDR